MNEQKGKLIVFEGISGTGKETQAKLLQSYLQARGIKSRVVYHPSPELKVLLSAWRKERNIDHITEVYLLLADRSDRVRQVIRPALAKGEWVISLRNWVSALVYQGKTAKERTWIDREFAKFEPRADVLFWFDIDPAMALARILARHKHAGEPIGKFETPALLNEKRKKYRNVLQNILHVRIDASRDITAMHKGICKCINVLIR